MMDHRNPPKPSDEFRKRLRAQLMQQAPLYLVPRRENAWTALLRSPLLRPALAVGLAALVLVAGAGTAAAGSVPGDVAYGLKRTFEDVQVALTLDDVQRVQLLSQLTDRRLQELQQIASRDDGQPGQGDDRAALASDEFAKAVEKFRAAVDRVQTAAPPATAEQVQKIAEQSREKHAPVVDQLQQKVNDDKAKDNLDKARDDEDKNTTEEQKGDQGQQGQNDDKHTARPTRTPSPSRTPRGSETPRGSQTPRVTTTPRGSERTETPRASTPRPSPTASR